jgi:hypothetical protein
LIRLCKTLDDMGFYRAADMLFRKHVESQFIQPSNNQNAPLETRMIPWSEVEDSFKQRDYDWFNKSPSLRKPEYMPLDGVYEAPYTAAEGGTNNSLPQKRETLFLERIKQINDMLQGYDLSAKEKKDLRTQLEQLKEKMSSAEGLVGSATDMQGPDQVPGPRQVIIDHSSPSMMGLEDFTWENRRGVHENSSDSYKNLLPN